MKSRLRTPFGSLGVICYEIIHVICNGKKCSTANVTESTFEECIRSTYLQLSWKPRPLRSYSRQPRMSWCRRSGSTQLEFCTLTVPLNRPEKQFFAASWTTIRSDSLDKKKGMEDGVGRVGSGQGLSSLNVEFVIIAWGFCFNKYSQKKYASIHSLIKW